MKKTNALLIIFSLGLTTAFAQLTTRENNPSIYKVGTRPMEGDYGVFIAGSLDEISGLFSEQSGEDALKPSGIPIVNLKYYLRDDVVVRVGFQGAKSKSRVKGDYFFPADHTTSDGDRIDFEGKSVSKEYVIRPGIEKHWSPSNIFDIYVGADAQFGYARAVYDQKINDRGGDFNYLTIKGGSIVYGLGAFIGLQFFVADLPIAFGFEYGFSGKGFLANRYKVNHEERTGGTSQTNEYFVLPDSNLSLDNPNAFTDPSVDKFKSLKSREFELDNMLRFTISYYFSR